MITVNPKYRYVRENSNHHQNNAFHFEVRGQKIRMCKCFFKATLSINDRPIQTVIEKKTAFTRQMISSDLRGKHGKHAEVEDGIKGVRNHIRSIPQVESHCCCAKITQEYIEGGKCVADLHRDYKADCEEKNIPAANYVMYSMKNLT
jgi:hypothetical protein